MHAVSHAPQCVAVSSGASQPLDASPSQSPHPASQVKPQRDDAQVAVAWAGVGHAFVHAPQWSGSSVRRRHDPSQLVSPVAQVETHAPPEHTWPDGHARPQPAQLRTSLRTSTSQPLGTASSQLARPAMHWSVHVPAVQRDAGFTT